jgi:predicted short-subunit dehydrogenase-like oxidoreductase (DUF2520 family)
VTRKLRVAIVGSGSLAKSLGPALRDSGYVITEIISREYPRSRRNAQSLASKVGARAATASTAKLNADVLWFCVPDRDIRSAAASILKRSPDKIRFAFHSSGALTSRELEVLRKKGLAVASVHPLMTFVPGSSPFLGGVPFAIEGDAAALKVAHRIVRDLGGKSFSILPARKPAYHAWATMTSPLFLAFLVTLEEAARGAGLTPEDARRKSSPIIRQTLENYLRLGPGRSFSGPIIRGDVQTIAKHLIVLRKTREAGDVYRALVHSALRRLPVKNRKEIERLLRS